MGVVTNLLKILGAWFPDKGTVFGGEAGDGVLGKIVFTVPLPPPKPPVTHETGHYPLNAGETSITPGYDNHEPGYRKLRLTY